MMNLEDAGKKILDKTTNVLVTKSSRNGIILVIAIMIVAILSGVLGAFKNGEFQRTYDFVSVDVELSKLNYDDPIFDSISKDSRQVKEIKIFYTLNEDGEQIKNSVEYYKGYYKNYFFNSYWFYAETSFNTILIMIFYLALINFLISKKQEKDDIYIALEKDINKLVITDNSLPSSTFEPFMEEWNNKRKVNQHIKNIKYDLGILEKNTNYKIRKIFQEPETKEFYLPEEPIIDDSTKKKKKITTKELKLYKKGLRIYYNKKIRLLSFLEDEYIKENVIYDKVKYFKYIYPSFVTGGKNGIYRTTDSYSTVESNEKTYTKDMLLKVIIGLATTVFFTSILSFTLIRTEDGWLMVLFNVLMKMLPLVLQVVFAISYSDTYTKKQLIPILRFRLSIANMYLSERSGQ